MSIRYHYNLIYNDLEDTLAAFRWDSVQVKMAFKTALSCATAVLIANWIKLEHPFWAGITTLVIMRPNVGAIFQKGWMRAVGCCIGCMISLYFLRFVIQLPLFFSIFIFLGICIAFYAGVQAKYDYFWSYMLANMSLIAMISMSEPYNNFPLHIAFYRGTEIALGVFVSWFYHIILWPRYAGNDLETNISDLLKNSTKYMREILYQYSTGKFDKDKVQKIYFKELKSNFTNCRNLMKVTVSERKLLKIDHTRFKTIINQLEYRVDHLYITYKSFYSFNTSSALVFRIKKFLAPIAELFDDILELKNVTSRNYYKEFYKLKRLLKQLDGKIENNELSINMKDYTINEVLVFYEFLYAINSFTKDILLIVDEKTAKKEDRKFRDDELKKFDSEFLIFNFKSKVFPLYLPALKNAIKGGLAILFTFWISLWLNIPGGYSNMAVAIIAVFAPQMDNMSTKHKGVLRFIGCLTGAAFGLLFLTFNIESVFFLTISIFLCCFFFCIIWAGKPGCAYIGLQAGIAFVICLAGNFEPSVTIAAVIERMTGIFLAISMMWFFNYIMFPENLVLKLKNKILDLKTGLFNYLQSDCFSSNEEKMAGEYTKALTLLNSKVQSLFKVIEIQQDLPFEEIEKIKSWVNNIQKIAGKLTVLDSLDMDVIEFAKENAPKLFKDISFTIRTVVNSTISAKSPDKIQKLIENKRKIIDDTMVRIRQTGLIRNKSAKMKSQFAVLIILLKHMLNDLKNLSEAKVNLEMLSMQ